MKGARRFFGFVDGCSQAISLRASVGPARKPLISTAELVDMGYCVIHDKQQGQDVSHAIHKSSGTTIPIKRVGNIYEWEIEVLRYEDVRYLSRPFPRAGHQQP